jgi:nitrogen fixation protein NifB
MAIDFSHHPCFNDDVRHRYGRIHLPVAPQCNMQCRFCNRLYDCVNESRPGVTSSVLHPAEALEWLAHAVAQNESLRVVGIAGPGDPFANARETLTTLRLVRERYPEMILCVATNGMALPDYAGELAKLRVSHVTVTVNATNPSIGAGIYRWMRDGSRVLRGIEGARRLLERQREAISRLKEFGIIVKVNSIIIPGVNTHHIPEIARDMAGLGVDIFNCIPLYPSEGAEFAGLGEPDAATTAHIRKAASAHIPQMHHCTRCRADAVGILGADTAAESLASFQKRRQTAFDPDRPCVAVATQEGMLVNVHLGSALDFMIFRTDENGPVRVDRRQAPLPGGGNARWELLAEILHDCRAVMVQFAGKKPIDILTRSGLEVVVMDGLIEPALCEYFATGKIPAYMSQSAPRGCGAGCGGDGGGCGG